MFLLVALCILLALCWPLAVMSLIMWPTVWLISIPLRLIGITIDAALALVKAVLYLPARVFGYRG
jgi:hypothetical protein